MHTQRPGHTLLELTIVLVLATLLMGVAAPIARAAIDRHAVRAARDSVAGALALTRATAIAHGGAVLRLDAADGAVRVFRADGRQQGDAVHIAHVHGVRLELSGGTPAEIRFDALGIGRMANRTIRLTRGRAEAGLTVSAYGRWRTW